jgi:D-amino-acid dehydrogenase
MSRVLVIGTGIVGLSCARSLLADGHQVTMIDRDPAGDKASFGNAGGIGVTEVIPASVPGLAWKVPRWLFDPLGPLSLRLPHLPRLIPWLWRFLRSGTWPEVERLADALAGLANRTFDDLLPLLAELDLADNLHRVGALWVYETEAGFQADGRYHDIRRRHGILCEEISAETAREMEPALSDSVRYAVFTPQWSHVSDPKRIVDRLRTHLESRGVTISAGEVTGLETNQVSTADGRTIPFDMLVVAAGAWSGRLARLVGDRALIESERGYNTTLPNPNVTLSREVIFAERQFVATPLEIGLRIGGAAEFAGLEAPAKFARCDALAELARRYLPGLNTAGGTRWMGHRPTTPDSLPVIGRSPRCSNVFYAFGHSHTGLTFGPTTGRLVAELIASRPPSVDLAPFSIKRFE